MKIAVPVHANRVSPLFDTAGRLLVVDLDGRQERGRELTVLDESYPFARVSRLQGLGIEVLICGGISHRIAVMLEDSGVRLIPWVAGEVEEVLEAYKSGGLPDPRFLMPGCGRRSRHGPGRGRGRGYPYW